VPVHEKKKVGHQARKARYSRVCLLIMREIFGPDRLGEGERLLEAQGETISCNGIDGARGVADEGNVASCDVPERAGERDGSAADSGGRSVAKSDLQSGKQCQIVSGGRTRSVDESDAELGGGDRSDVGLADLAPIDLDEIGVRCRGVVLADADARATGGFAVKAGEGSYAGVQPVGSDEIARLEEACCGGDFGQIRASGLNRLYRGLPLEPDSETDGAVEHELVQACSANAYARRGAKETLGGCRRVGRIEETDSTKRGVFCCEGVNAETTERFDGRRHQAFAACFVDGGAMRVRNDDGETAARRCNGCRETGRAGTGDEQIGSVQRAGPFVIRRTDD
jgi:hypothetical protein